jgi:hypothetical protein
MSRIYELDEIHDLESAGSVCHGDVETNWR